MCLKSIDTFRPRSGLCLTVTRAYSPTYGRFLSRDLLFGKLDNFYSYVGNAPFGYVDPAGLDGVKFNPSAVMQSTIMGSTESMAAGALGMAGQAFLYSLQQWAQTDKQRECGEECLRSYEADMVIGKLTPAQAFQNFKCCMIKNQIETTKSSWFDVLSGNYNDEVKELKKQQTYNDLLKALGIPPAP